MHKLEVADTAPARVLVEAKPARNQRSITTWGTLALPLIPFLSLYVWRPFGLGFYSDDWYTLMHPEPGSARAFFDLQNLYGNRPVSVLVVWPAQSFIAWNPAYAQVVNVLLTAAAAGSVGLLACALGQAGAFGRDAARFGGGVAAALFLAFPWTLGFSAWATAATAVAPATIFFCLGAFFLVGERGERLGSQLIACLIMAASFLAYESFYGQFVPILALAAALRRSRQPNWMMLRPALLLLVVNIGCVAFNRMAQGNRKSFDENWLSTFFEGYFRSAFPIVSHSFHEVRLIVVVSAILSSGIGIYFVARQIGPRRTTFVVLATLAGIYAAGALYAMAGYLLTTVGIMARVTVVMSVYGALFYGLLCAASIRHRGWLARWQIAASLVLLAGFGIASSLRLVDWVQSWQAQRKILEQFPLVASETEAFKGGFLFVGPHGPSEVPTATATWEISGAVAYALSRQSPAMGSRAMAAVWSGDQPWFADMRGWSTDWDGNRFSQTMCENSAVQYVKLADTVNIWRVGEQGFSQRL
jgi:hypothetical protein